MADAPLGTQNPLVGDSCSPVTMAPQAQAQPQASSASAKSLVVRIKRKRLLPPIESLWLEVSERPAKRPELEISSLCLNDVEHQNPCKMVEARSKRLLFHHLETVKTLGAEDTSRVESLLMEARDGKMASTYKDRRKSSLKSNALAQTARFEQVWKRCKGANKDDSMSELFHLYDVVRLDVEADIAEKHRRQEQENREAELAENHLLRNYLPLLKEYLPTAAAKLESDVPLQPAEEDEYVYDVYAPEEDANGDETNEYYPMVHVIDDEDLRWGESSELEFDSEDSNDENNPLNDYPEEEDSGSEIKSDAEDTESDSDIQHEEQFSVMDGSDEYDGEFSEDFADFCGDNNDSADD